LRINGERRRRRERYRRGRRVGGRYIEVVVVGGYIKGN